MTFSDLSSRSYRADCLIREIREAIDAFEAGAFSGPRVGYEVEEYINSMLDLVDELDALGTDPGAADRFREDISTL